MQMKSSIRRLLPAPLGLSHKATTRTIAACAARHIASPGYDDYARHAALPSHQLGSDVSLHHASSGGAAMLLQRRADGRQRHVRGGCDISRCGG